jgi:DNA polymerase I-like protein with 3'-5' exonuclease and polymerase domains
MKIVTYDLECYYDREYSLSRLTTEEFCRSPLFEMIGFAIKVDDGPTQWVPKPECEAFIKAFDWSDAMVLCQNTAFDGAILNWRYGVNPAVWADTLGMSRALFPHEKAHSLKAQAERAGIGAKGEEVNNAIGKRYADFSEYDLAKYADYCINDVGLTYTLFRTYLSMGFPKGELKLIDLTLRMFIEPVLELDRPLLEQHYQDVVDRKEKLLYDVRGLLEEGGVTTDGDLDTKVALWGASQEELKKLLMSNDKFATLLQSLGVSPPTKISQTTGKVAWAFAKTDDAFKALEEHPDERVQALVAARLGNKTTLEETRTQRFIGMSGRGKFPVPLRYYGAHSGRWSGQDSVNLQNLPSRGANAGKIKKSIKAPPGYVVIDCDSAQIEARTLAWLAGQDDLVQAFRDKQDVYKLMASKIYGIPIESVDKTQRQVGKTVVLGAGYGVGHKKLQAFLKTQAGVEVTLDEAKRIIDTYRSTSFKIADLWAKAGRALSAMLLGQSMTIDEPGLIKAVPGEVPMLTLPNGLHIQYPDLRVRLDDDGNKELTYTSKGLPVRIYGGKVVENICQAVARQIVAEQMLRIAKRYKVVLTVHDAVACIAPEAEAKEAQAYVEECMSWNPKWAVGLPLSCESGMGASYGDC